MCNFGVGEGDCGRVQFGKWVVKEGWIRYRRAKCRG